MKLLLLRIRDCHSITCNPTAGNLWIANLRGDVRPEDLNKMLEMDSKIKVLFDTSVFWYTMMKLINEHGKDGDEMSAQTAFQRIAVERGWDRAWEAKGKEEGRSEGIFSTISILKGLRNNIPIEQLAAETDMTVEEVEKIQAELLTI